MARIISFFKRQTLVGTPQEGGEDYYSQIYDATDIKTLISTIRVYGTTHTETTVTGTIEHTSCPMFDSDAWSQATEVQSTGIGSGSGVATSLKQYVRAKIKAPSGAYITVSLDAVARGTS